MGSNCLVTYIAFNSSCEATNSKYYPRVMTPQGRLERLKNTLKSKIQQMEDQDGTINELESHLKIAKEDLTRLKEKCQGKDKTRQSIELAKYEDKLQQFRNILLDATSHLEKVLRNMSHCHDCRKSTNQRMIAEQGKAIHCVRKDLESLQIKKNGDSCVTCDSGIQTEDRSFASEERNIKKSKSLNMTDIEDFRKKSVAGLTVLEDMKEQIDVLHGLVKNYFEQMPGKYEKCQIEDCENKFQKLHEEFECIAEALSALLDSLYLTPSDNSDGSCNCRKRSSDESSPRSNLSDKVATLKSEQKQLHEEICEQQSYLERVKNELKEAETALREKKCQSEEQDKDLESKQEEISKLIAGVKEFKGCLRNMKIEIADEVTPEGSCSSISILSSELQELCDILTSLQSSFPGIIEKCRVENQQMKSTISCLEKCLENKEQTSLLLQKTLELRDGQIDDLNYRIQSQESQIEKLNQEVCEKARLIGNLQDSMRKAKEFEMKIKDEYIATLQFEVCELDARLKAILKEVVKKRKEVEVLQDEILYVSSKNFILNREIDLLEPKLGKMQKNLVLYEKMVCELQKELESRNCEIEDLYEKVRGLEQELEFEMKKCEEQTLNDAKHIDELNGTIRKLQHELKCANSPSRKSSPIRSSRSERGAECNENEDFCTICLIRAEINELKQFIAKSGKQAEIKKIIERLEAIIDQGKCRQEAFNDKINELQNTLEKTVALHKCEKENLVQKMQKEEMENSKNKILICKLNESIKRKLAVENDLRDKIENLKLELQNIKYESDYRKSCMENMKLEGKINRDKLNREELDKLINDLEAQKSVLKAQCSTFKSELEKEENIKRCLEIRIDELNDMLSKKTLQFKELSQNYKCTSAEAQEALAKLKDAELRLKCMKMAMNRNDCGCSEGNGRSGKEETMNNECLEAMLADKTAECNKLMAEVDCLQNKLKTVQNNYVSAQSNRDCEVSRMNQEVCRLESELDLAEKENCKLRNDVKQLQDELKNMAKREKCCRTEIENKEKELNSLMCDKKSLLQSVDELQKRLEEICMDSAAKEKENRELRDQSMRLQKEINDVQSEMCELKQDFESLQMQSCQTAEQLRCNGRKLGNLKKLYRRATEENACLEETRCTMEKDLNEIKNENSILKQKIQYAKKQEMELKKLKSESTCAAEERMKLSCAMKDLNTKVKNLEGCVIPQLEEELMEKDRCIESLKSEMCDANASSQKMRDESQRVIKNTKKYLGAQRNSCDALRSKSPCHKDNRCCGNNDNRDLEDFRSVTCMTDQMYYNGQNNKNTYQDAEPRSFSPLPWGCSNVERDNCSPDYAVESGFQSMQPSPINMNYIDYGQDMKRTPSQWNNNIPIQMENHYSSCRNPAR